MTGQASVVTEQTSVITEQTVNVWDLLIRLFQWSLVASFAIAWLTAEGEPDLHEWAGYAAAALITFRIVLGIFGSNYARFRGW